MKHKWGIKQVRENFCPNLKDNFIDLYCKSDKTWSLEMETVTAKYEAHDVIKVRERELKLN